MAPAFNAEYNQLLRIERELGPQARYGGRSAVKAPNDYEDYVTEGWDGESRVLTAGVCRGRQAESDRSETDCAGVAA